MGTDEFGRRMNSIPQYVVSRRWPTTGRPGARPPAPGDVAAEIAKLRAAPGGDLLVEGSCQLAQTLFGHGLVDEYRLMVFPIILGAGKRLFPAQMDALGHAHAHPFHDPPRVVCCCSPTIPLPPPHRLASPTQPPVDAGAGPPRRCPASAKAQPL